MACQTKRLLYAYDHPTTQDVYRLWSNWMTRISSIFRVQASFPPYP